ncbi:broad substrate specificity ATP-binding cassette transporter ABCG2-like [Antedon mediterranea]|uniref:broad substrate specificity ATP-binding cassette transporter ABCG2-like n=1 Tax=Antedon mediterranea TaxID=105859 RepID=UPI003AF4BD48
MMTEKTSLLGNGRHPEVSYAGVGGLHPSYQAADDNHHKVEVESTNIHSVVSFHNICYRVLDKAAGKDVYKNILTNISGVFAPGMNGIMGPTGSGKTSLLDVLAARKHPKGLSGAVLIDGKPQPAQFRLISGYVVQDDVVMGTMSVKENLRFSAELRLGKEISTSEKRRRVNDIIKELGLTKCADSKVGTLFIRGISGGERKRTNVGMELVTKPRILFLDEPTTGLDASTAKSVMTNLAQLSKRGRTIIFSIHQPRYSIFSQFNKLHLLSLGQTVYHGPANETNDFFGAAGYPCPEFNNPADFFLDVIIEQEQSENAIDGTKTLVEYFNKSKYNTVLEEEERKLTGLHRSDSFVEQVIDYPTSVFKQFAVLSKRAFTNMIRNPQTSSLQVLIMVVLGIFVGGLFWQLDTSQSSGIQNRIGVFFFMIMNVTFGNMSALEVFIYERVIFRHESASGFYRASAYFFSMVLCDLIPMRIVPTTIYCCITYWMIGLQPTATNFFIFLLDLLVTTMTGCSLVFCISATVGIYGIAVLIAAMSMIIMVVFGGLFINISSLPVWLQWLQYLSMFRFSLNTLTINELKGMVFCDPPLNASAHYYDPVTCITGEAYMDQQGIDYSTWGLWQNQMALGIMILVLLTLSYIQLRRIPKYK